ncbi:HAD-IIA family hydrolase [Neobacillus niacini]|uniref:HAD-IIA family hydrolase n=1 Tax=Neobacillus niacini TaxID=86668 RepID=UPI00203E8C06|nr:HAD-IIA family hydrolase [Neobacillus niacini]MCM3693208.1 HAD-IIA family hydrolase [Neobacillus niacini]
MIGTRGLSQKKLFLLDMDGTIYLDNILFDKSLEFLEALKNSGGKYVFLTNNSSKSVQDYIVKLTHLGIHVDESNFLTSSQATSIYLTQYYKNKKIYVLGTESFKKELEHNNIWVTDRYDQAVNCLVVGFDTELTFNKLVDACQLLNNGVDFIATNMDLVCPTSHGFIPDCGSICNMLATATGRQPTFIGKPNPLMVELAIKNSDFSKDETIVLGDRLYTDIACGINAGVTTGVVLTGETKIGDLDNTNYKPDFVFENIKEVYNNLNFANPVFPLQ